ncbi:class I SAM-dependent methyltransferase [bacterium]|nr:class I SAM-dependent methyltransferase [bacterium]
MSAPDFYPATLRVAVLWGGPDPERTLLPGIKVLLTRGAVVDVGVLPGARTGALTSDGIPFHTDHGYLETFVAADGSKCLLCGTRQDAPAPAIIDLCAKYGIPALDGVENAAVTVACIMALAAANKHPAAPRTHAADGRPLFPDLSYERYVRLMGIARQVAPEPGPSLGVLDIGGEDAALRDFLPGAAYETFDGLITRAQGTGLPDRSYDVVVAADVLEHVLPADRAAFLQELVRLARRRVVFSFPCAEAALHERFLLDLLPGHRWLKEHRENGLPAVDEVASLLDGLGLRYERHPNHSLQNWVYSVMFDMMGLSRDLGRAVNLFLQEFVFPLESAEPAYRNVFVIRR